jgi:DNA helicase-2/ATP-dependent DNA helicase PcrA
MDAAQEPTRDALSAGQRRVVEHDSGTLAVIGSAATGKTEALARRLARIASEGDDPGAALVVTCSHAAAARIRTGAEAALSVPYEELWIGTYAAVAERLLRDYAVEAGLDPFFEPVGAADRLAMMLERIDRLPLRRHEIRGNPAGLLARLLQRIDALKTEGVSATDLASRAQERERSASGEAEVEAARREVEFAALYAEHDRILREAGTLDAGDLVSGLTRLLQARPDVRERLSGRFPHLIADEYEDAGAARRDMLAALAAIARTTVISCDDDQAISPVDEGSGGVAELRRRHHGADELRLEECFRCGDDAVDAARAVVAPIPGHLSDGAWRSRAAETAVRFWRCDSERAEAQAVAREVEHLIAAGEVRPEMVGVVVTSIEAEGRAVAAALEERSVPFRLAGPAAFFRRPEVRDVMAWLRVLADPNDAAAAVRALTRPPIELRSVDLARCTTIARRRKLDIVSALDAALESPQLPPEARDRLHGFLRLYRAAAPALEELRADVFVRRLIERVGLRRHRLFAAHPEAAERLLSLSRLADLADAWARREPGAPTRDFVRYLTAVAEAGVPSEDEPARPAPPAVRVMEPRQVKGLELDHVYVLGLNRRPPAARSPAVPAPVSYTHLTLPTTERV